jgi:cyclic nucleotide gated channel
MTSKLILSICRATPTCSKGIFGKVLNPRSNAILRYNQWFLVSCVVGAAIDPLFLSVLAINKELSCLYMQKGFAIAITTLRSLVDIMYMWQIWLQLKLAYVSKKSLILGQGELVWDARKIARHYLLPLRRFWFDAFVILPIPQVLLFGHYHCFITHC